MTDGDDPTFDPQAYDEDQGFVAEYGRDVLEILDPQPGDRILDLGCGTGHLTANIAEAVGPDGTVVGIDAAPEMVEEARDSYPDLDLRVVDATEFAVDEPVDAVFSNAALHWIGDQDAALDRVAATLRPGGRFVAEMGARGNVEPVVDAVRAEGATRGVAVRSPWHFPTLGEYTTRLEAQGFQVRLARTFDRQTTLEGPSGLADWLDQFGDALLSPFGRGERAAVVDAVEDRLRPEYFDAAAGNWTVPYRRLQFEAVR